MFIKITKHILYMIFLILFKNNNTKNILVICSMKLDNIYGNIFCLPQKYPLIIEEIVMNGIVSEMHINGKYKLEFLSRVVDINLDENSIISIIKKLIKTDMGIIE